jgi:hypothetical protein
MLMLEKGGLIVTCRNENQTFLIFKPRYLEKGQTMGKVLFFWRSFFL